MSNSFPLLYIWYSYKVAIFIFENLVKNCLFFSIVAFVMYGWIDKLVRNYSWSNFIKFIKISHNENDSLREIFYSHSLHFLPFCSYFYIYIYTYISLDQKLQQRFTASRFNFTFISANPFLPNPKKRAFFQRSSVTFQLTPVGRVGKFRLWNTRRGTTRGGTLVARPLSHVIDENRQLRTSL